MSSFFGSLLHHAAHARPSLTALAVFILMYWAHRALQHQYHRRCKADLIRVVLFNQSTMCSHISGVLQIVEVACDQAMRHLAGQVIGALSGGLLGVAASVALAASDIGGSGGDNLVRGVVGSLLGGSGGGGATR